MTEPIQLRKRDFSEYPRCALCGENDPEQFMNVAHNSNLVRCRKCSLVYTSPRADEAIWERFLRSSGNPRNVEFTENRLKHGAALQRRFAEQPEDWREQRTAEAAVVLSQIRDVIERPLNSLHDVGCGVGFLLMDAREQGLTVSGNDLNGYACEVMRSRFGLDITCGSFPESKLPTESRDAVTMTDYIEHTYHPDLDLKEAFRVLSPGGAVFVRTFRIDCKAFKEKGADWNMLRWNHVYHFSTDTLRQMIEKAGFIVKKIERPPSWKITIVGVKPKG